MGTWSTSLFGGDISRDVRENYIAYLQMGMTGRAATKQILEDYADELEDTTQDGPVVWFALADTQWGYGRLEPRVKSKALKIIRQGGDLAAWSEKYQPKRRRVLEKLRAKLESPPPAEKRVRIRKPAEPLKEIEKYWTPGQVVAFRRDSGRYLLLLTEGVTRDEYRGERPYFVLLNWEGTKIPPPEKIRTLPYLDYVIAIDPNSKGEKIPWDRVERLKVKRPRTKIIYVTDDEVYRERGWEDCQWKELDDCISNEFDKLPWKKKYKQNADIFD